MATKLYPPQIEGTLPAFYLQYDASGATIVASTLPVPYTNNATVNEELITGFVLRLRTASTGSYLFPPINSSTYNIAESTVNFIIPANYAKLLNEGQYYKIQIAYLDNSGTPGYFSTVGVIKCTSKPTVYINNLDASNINFFTNEFAGVYDQSECRDQTEKVYSYEFCVYDDEDNLYYTTGEKLHQAAYDTEYSFSVDKVMINDYVSNGKTYSIQYKVVTLNGLELSTPRYKLTNDNLVSPNKPIEIIPKSDPDNGYIDIHFKGDKDEDRSYYYILNKNNTNILAEKDTNEDWIEDSNGKTIQDVILSGINSTSQKLDFLKNHSLYKIIEKDNYDEYIKSSSEENSVSNKLTSELWQENKNNIYVKSPNKEQVQESDEYDYLLEYYINEHNYYLPINTSDIDNINEDIYYLVSKENPYIQVDIEDNYIENREYYRLFNQKGYQELSGAEVQWIANKEAQQLFKKDYVKCTGNYNSFTTYYKKYINTYLPYSITSDKWDFEKENLFKLDYKQVGENDNYDSSKQYYRFYEVLYSPAIVNKNSWNISKYKLYYRDYISVDENDSYDENQTYYAYINNEYQISIYSSELEWEEDKDNLFIWDYTAVEPNDEYINRTYFIRLENQYVPYTYSEQSWTNKSNLRIYDYISTENDIYDSNTTYYEYVDEGYREYITSSRKWSTDKNSLYILDYIKVPSNEEYIENNKYYIYINIIPTYIKLDILSEEYDDIDKTNLYFLAYQEIEENGTTTIKYEEKANSDNIRNNITYAIKKDEYLVFIENCTEKQWQGYKQNRLADLYYDKYTKVNAQSFEALAAGTYYIRSIPSDGFRYEWSNKFPSNNKTQYILIDGGRNLIKSLSYSYIRKNSPNLANETILETSEQEAYYYGSYILSRASDEDNYTTWYTISRFRFDQEYPSDFSVRDITIEHGRKYKYGLQQYNIWGLTSSRIMSDPYEASFEDMFLYDGDRLLKIRFNPKVTSFKTTILEQKSDTIGGRYPFITRNGETYYKEFPIGGLIAQEMDEKELFIKRGLVVSHRHSTSAILEQEPTNSLRDYHMFSDENIFLERQFKLEVLKWLNDGKPKLFKSPYEGNYIVRLMQNTLTPVEQLGRMLHSFTSQAYEIAEYNYENLIAYGFLNVQLPSSYVGLWKTYNIPEQPRVNGMYEIDFEAGLENFVIQDMMPGDIVHIYYAEEATPQDIMIGITGSYTYTGSDKTIIKMLIEPMSPIDQTSDRNTTGVVHCYYQGLRITAFDAIINQQLHTIIGQQFIGVNPIMIELKVKKWENISNDFTHSVKNNEYKELQNYNFRDYLDIREDPQNNGDYLINSKFVNQIHTIDPNDILEKINLTIGDGRAYKIQLLNIEQMKFTLREVIPVYQIAYNGNVPYGVNNSGDANLMVATSPYGYPHPIEELAEIEMLDPFCIFQVYIFDSETGNWMPTANGGYYDAYYNSWIREYDPTIKINYEWVQAKNFSKDMSWQDTQAKDNITEGVYNIRREPIDSSENNFKYYYEPTPGYKIYFNTDTDYEFFNKSGDRYEAISTQKPTSIGIDKIYWIKKYDTIMNLETEKQVSFKNMGEVNSIHIGSGIIADVVFQLKVTDFYTEVRNADVAQAKQDYLNAKRLLQSLASDYATLAEADYYRTKYKALKNAYNILLNGGTNTGRNFDINDKKALKGLLDNLSEVYDMSFLKLYELIEINSESLRPEFYEQLLDIKKETESDNKTGLFKKINTDNQTFNYGDKDWYYLNNDFNVYFLIQSQEELNQYKEEDNIYILQDIYFLSYTEEEEEETEYYVTNNMEIPDIYKIASGVNNTNVTQYYLWQDGKFIKPGARTFSPSNTYYEKIIENPNSITFYRQENKGNKDNIKFYKIINEDALWAIYSTEVHDQQEALIRSQYKPIFQNPYFNNKSNDENNEFYLTENSLANNEIIILPLKNENINSFVSHKLILLTDEEVKEIKNEETFISLRKIELPTNNENNEETVLTFYEEETLKNISETKEVNVEGLVAKNSSLEKEIDTFNSTISNLNEKLISEISEYTELYNNLMEQIRAHNEKVYQNWCYQEYLRLLNAGENQEQIFNFFSDNQSYIDSNLLELQKSITKYPEAIEKLYDDSKTILPKINNYKQICKDNTNDLELDNYMQSLMVDQCGKLILNLITMRQGLVEFFAKIQSLEESDQKESYKKSFEDSFAKYKEIYQSIIIKTEEGNNTIYKFDEIYNDNLSLYINKQIEDFKNNYNIYIGIHNDGSAPDKLASLGNIYEDLYFLGTVDTNTNPIDPNLKWNDTDEESYYIYTIPSLSNLELVGKDSNTGKYYNYVKALVKQEGDPTTYYSNPYDEFRDDYYEYTQGQLRTLEGVREVGKYFYRRTITRRVYINDTTNSPTNELYTTFIFNPLAEIKDSNIPESIDNNKKYFESLTSNQQADVLSVSQILGNKMLAIYEEHKNARTAEEVKRELENNISEESSYSKTFLAAEAQGMISDQNNLSSNEVYKAFDEKNFDAYAALIESDANKKEGEEHIYNSLQKPKFKFVGSLLTNPSDNNYNNSTEEIENIANPGYYKTNSDYATVITILEESYGGTESNAKISKIVEGSTPLDTIGPGVFKEYLTLFSESDLAKQSTLLEQAMVLHDLYIKQYDNYSNKLTEYTSIYENYDAIYSSYIGTEVFEFYQNTNGAKTIEEYRQEVKEAWWKFIDLLDKRYTEEVERGMYV